MILSLLFALTLLQAHAQTSTRAESLSKAIVWSKPSWIDTSFRFSSVDLFDGPARNGWETAIDRTRTQCEMRDVDVAHQTHGMTNKFHCGVDGHSVKFKYTFDDGEITSEILGTRLLWALGFAADRMYAVDRLECKGCTADPFEDRRIDPSAKPRVFENVAAERKFSKHYIGRGWTFEELMSSKPGDPERDALRLLSVFIEHADNKAENQDIACQGVVTKRGGCSGPIVLMLQDLGATFGLGQVDSTTMSKAWFPDWKGKAIWKDPAKCIANLGMNSEADMYEPEISEAGRAFLAKLLRGFSEGPEGRARVEAMFRAAHADWRGGEIKDWTDAFLAKVSEIDQPTGVADFHCP